MLSSWVSFAGWSVGHEERSISPATLSPAFCQRVGRLCEANTSAIDLVLPMVVYGDEDKAPGGEEAQATRPAKRPKRATAAAAAATPFDVDLVDAGLWPSAVDRCFLPHRCELQTVAVRVKRYPHDMSLAVALRDSLRPCDRRSSQTVGLSLLCLTGAGRVRCPGLPDAAVLLYVARPKVSSSDSSGDSGSCSGCSRGEVDIVVNGFAASLLCAGGGTVAALQQLVDVDRAPSGRLLAECLDEDLATQRRQMAHRLPHHFDTTATGQTPAAQAEPEEHAVLSTSEDRLFDRWQPYDVHVPVSPGVAYRLTVYSPATSDGDQQLRV